MLVKELQSLGLAVEVLNEEEEEVTFAEDAVAPTYARSTSISAASSGGD